MSAFTAREQLFLEYVNRARLDPLNEAARLLADPSVPQTAKDNLNFGTDGLNRGLPSEPISGLPLQPLAPNGLLRDAAAAHTQWMLDANVFSHVGEGGSSVSQRIAAAGYSVVFPGGTGENLSWRGTTGTINLDSSVIGHHAGLFASDGHRRNILTDWFRETGVAQLRGDYTHTNDVTYDSSMLTQKFAASGYGVFLTGVAYRDLDGDWFYSLGEGQAGVTVSAAGETTQTGMAGGYSLGLVAAQNVAVTLSWGSVEIGATVDLSAGNVKLDLVAGAGGILRLLSSGDMVLGTGAGEGELLGAANLTLRGNNADNLLIGNRGNNVLQGGAGNDTLVGGAGNDTIDGGSGTNTARFSGRFEDYLLTTDGAATIVADQRGPGTALVPHDGTDRLTNIRFLAFSDQTVDLAPPSPAPSESFRVSGNVMLNGDGAHGISVRFTAQDGGVQSTTTDATGTFSFDLAAGASGSLDLVRAYTVGVDKAPDIMDVLATFRLVAGVSSQPTPEAAIAADFNIDGKVDILDVLALFRHVAGVQGQATPRFVFFEESEMPDSVALNTLPHSAPFAIDALSGDMDFTFKAILTGDVLV